MAEPTARDAKLIQYLNEAYAKERELVTALQAHISLTTRDAYKKRLKDHLGETKAQAKGLERRIKQLGGKAETVELPGPEVIAETAAKAQAAAQKAIAATKGPLHAIRGTSEPETMLKNAKTEFFNEAEEIANYHAIEALAEALGDRDTAKLAREFRRQEERMAKFLEKTITTLTKEVVRTEIPASERNGGKSSGSAKRSGNGRSASAGKKPAAAKRTTTATAKRTTATAKRKSPASKRKSTAAKG